MLILSGCTSGEVKKEQDIKGEKIVKLQEEIEIRNMEMEALRARHSELEKRMLRLQKIQKEKTSEINQLYNDKADLEARMKKHQLEFNRIISEEEKETLKENIYIMKKQNN